VKVKSKSVVRIVLLRSLPSGFETLLTSRRHDAGQNRRRTYRFPGGAVRPDDCTPEAVSRCHGLPAGQARLLVGAWFSPREAVGFWVAALRELFACTGVLLARDEKEQPVVIDAARATGLAARRLALLSRSVSFSSLLREQNLLCDAGRLVYFSQWQTCHERTDGRDARFFVAEFPPDQSPALLAEDSEHSRWITPDQALELFRKGELPMTLSTFASLRVLADFDRIENVLREYRGMPVRRNAEPR
jgi:8-oxo-dGTP pyrophosphatase MutT (NUDIX family)